jgi:hypothetical protein
MCGFDDSGWDLPSLAQLQTMSAYVSDVSREEKGTWFNEHGFSDIKNNGVYWGQRVANSARPSEISGGAWAIGMKYGFVNDYLQDNSGSNTYGWGVHSRP